MLGNVFLVAARRRGGGDAGSGVFFASGRCRELEEATHVSLCVYHIIYDTMMKLKSRPIWLK